MIKHTLWGGRFSAQLDPLTWQFNASITFDWRLAEVDVIASLAWVKALEKAGVLSTHENTEITSGLENILGEIRAQSFLIQPGDEDVHSAIERRLTELIGPAAGKLHTGRSRNDQVATDFNLWLMQAITQMDVLARKLQTSICDRGQKDFGILINGYTHFQQSQPVLLSHWWLSHFWPLARDRQRLAQLLQRASTLPLGSGALAGCPYPIDRAFLANELGFAAISPNSIDAVSNRDEAAEFLFICALMSVHLSRLSEALILFSTSEFAYFRLSDAYTTGSSLMPQKKNPDTLELTRGKCGTIIGDLTGLLCTLKGLPCAYDKDLQEDKKPVFEVFDTLCMMLPVMQGVLDTLQVDADRMRELLNPLTLSTDLADYLVAHGLPFREAHDLVGRAVRRSEELQVPLDKMPMEEFLAISSFFGNDLVDVFDFEKAVVKRNLPGGTAPQSVREQLEHAISMSRGACVD